LDLAFTGTRKPKSAEEPLQIVSSRYQFDLGSFGEDPDKRKLTYRSPSNNEYRVEIVINRDNSVIEVSKFRGQNLLLQVSGATFDGAMAHATMCGMEGDEWADYPLSP
jgi:hypothetical protein